MMAAGALVCIIRCRISCLRIIIVVVYGNRNILHERK